jgi:ribulose-phosphate 3-epimerase
MKNKIAPSMMCADIFKLRETVDTFEKCGIELLHIDVMDGVFVPNLQLGTDYTRQLKNGSRIPVDIHLMIENPERHIASFAFGEGDYVSIHYETTKHAQKVLQAIKDRGAKALLAINPATPVEVAIDVLDDIDGFMLMTVNPGFAGQKMVPHAIDKIARARAFLDANGKKDAEIEVDGNVSIPNAIRMKEAGANIFVAGTSAVFMGDSIEDNIVKFRKEVFGE